MFNRHGTKAKYVTMAIMIGCLMAFVFTSVAVANPPGVPKDRRLVYKFNLIGYPEGKEYTGGCGQGNRIFVNRNANHAHILVKDQNDGWHIEDCNATSDNWAELHTDYPEGNTYEVYVRILGKPGGELRICAMSYEDHQNGETLCLLGEINLKREGGQSKFGLKPKSIFDASLEDIVWDVTTNPDYRIAQFRVYEVR